jgi:hypothetical protein
VSSAKKKRSLTDFMQAAESSSKTEGKEKKHNDSNNAKTSNNMVDNNNEIDNISVSIEESSSKDMNVDGKSENNQDSSEPKHGKQEIPMQKPAKNEKPVEQLVNEEKINVVPPPKSLAEILQKGEMLKTYRGFYIDNDISQALDKLSKKGGKGVISEIANVAIRQYLTNEGVLK